MKRKQERKIVKVNKLGICLVAGMLLAVIMFAGAYAEGFSLFQSNTQYSQPTYQEFYSQQNVDYKEFWPILGDPDKCEARQDFMVAVRPGGCMPLVVRSDLLEEQNVPVFCKLDAIKLNPLIDVAAIKSVGFKGDYPAEIAGVSFHPSQAALRIYNKVLDSPLMNDVGYVVVVLKKQEAEKLMKNYVEANLTAVLKYDVDNVIGAGKTSFYLPVMDDNEWIESYKENSFWKGRGYIRADWVEKDKAEISIYRDSNTIIRTITLEKGQTSDLIYMPGFYCKGGIKINLRDLKPGIDKARLQVGDDEFWLVKGEKFLDDKCYVKEIKTIEAGTGEVTLNCMGKPSTLNLKVRMMENNEDGSEIKLADETCGDGENSECEKDFREASQTAYSLVESYKGEKNDAGEYYGAVALWQLAELAGKLKKQETQKQVLTDLKDKYPESVYDDNAQIELERLNYYDYKDAAGSLAIGTKTYYIKLIETAKPDANDASAEFKINGELRERKYLIDENVVESGEAPDDAYVKILELDDDNIKIEYKTYNEETKTYEKGKQQAELAKGKSFTINYKSDNGIVKKTITLEKINLKRQAQVSLISSFPSGTSEANFSVKIGIEKRAIKLSPEKTKDMIANLNKSIEKFQGIVDRLGSVVEGLKGACFATTAVLIVKNFFQNLGGKSLARKEAMNKYWKSQCQKEVAESNGEMTLDGCYGKHAGDIEKSVGELQESMNNRNKEISKVIADNTKSGGFLEGSQTDMKKATKDYSETFKTWKDKNGENVAVKINNKERRLSELSNEEINQMVDEGDLTISQMRDIMMYGSLKEEVNNDLKNTALGAELSPIFRIADENKAIGGVGKLAKEIGISMNVPKVVGNIYEVDTITGEELKKYVTSSSAGKIQDDKKYMFFPVPSSLAGENNYGGENLLVEVSGSGENLATEKGYVVKTAKGEDGVEKFKITGNEINKGKIQTILNDENLKIGNIIEINKGDCKNRYLNAKVKFYETEPYKGMPAVVPVDVEEGWYAGTKQTLPGFSGISSFQASGAVSSLYLCNVGKNGREEWNSPAGDDGPCTQINYDTGQPSSQLGRCFTADEARRIASQAKSLVEDAASQYGKSRIRLRSGDFAGERAVQTPEIECQDFMSPTDCSTLFNVCDPVLCPSSRCNFGGTWPVDNVIQSGIIGSVLLCLPNFGVPPKGVLIPVCLSGIHAGLDAYVSILKSHRDCLQENLNSGKTVGICDEIYSIYLCEFFWRQAAPVLDIALPKLIEIAYTGGETQGGGEYLTVQNAWDNMKQSTTFMTNYYGVNAFKAFQARSTADVGTEVCKAFIGTSLPSKIDTLLEPESPVQFYARFDEIEYTDATVPATSQYKVYYHIFAGREQGHYYQVYLKSPPETAYYATTAKILVDSGYVGIGQTIDLTKDFTAPAGYKELCVVIDAKEECGFKQVTTSFAVDYLKDKYVAEQAEEEITSEKACVSGTPSLWALPSGSAEEAVTPSVYNRGLIRICSSGDPGERTNPGRWKDVGYCSSDKKIRCWLDTESAKDAIQDTGIENEVLSEAEKMTRQLGEQEVVMDEDKTNANLASAKQLFKQFEKNPSGEDSKNLIINLKAIEKDGFFNNQKAEAMFLEFGVYKIKVENVFEPAAAADTNNNNNNNNGEAVEEEKSVDKEKVSEAKCGECGEDWGFLNPCDADECHELGKCYFNPSGRICSKCPEKCNDFNKPAFASYFCILESTHCDLNCKFVDNICYEKTAEVSPCKISFLGKNDKVLSETDDFLTQITYDSANRVYKFNVKIENCGENLNAKIIFTPKSYSAENEVTKDLAQKDGTYTIELKVEGNVKKEFVRSAGKFEVILIKNSRTISKTFVPFYDPKSSAILIYENIR